MRLLSPLRALMRSRGELPTEEEMPGATFPPNPLWEQLCQALECGAFGTVQSVKAPRHINIGELRAALRAEAKVGRMHPGCRYLQLLDSQVALGALVKGRASSKALNFELTRSLPDHLGSRIRPFFSYATSGSNPSDDPTRHRAIRSPSMPLPAWLREALEGRFELFDAFLTEEGLHPEQLRNLPNPRELAADAPVDPQPCRDSRLDRASKPAEARAASLLPCRYLSRFDILDLFSVLPSICAKRKSKSRIARAFQAGAFVHGGVCGLMTTTRVLPLCVQVLARFVGQLCPSLYFSTVSIFENNKVDAHRDSNNAAESVNFVYALSRFKGGRLWVQTAEGKASIRYKGAQLRGEYCDPQRAPVLFDPRRLHVTEGWTGRRVVLIAHCIRNAEKLCPEDASWLRHLGFRLREPSNSELRLSAPATAVEPVLKPAMPRPRCAAGLDSPKGAFDTSLQERPCPSGVDSASDAVSCIPPSLQPADFSDLVGLPRPFEASLPASLSTPRSSPPFTTPSLEARVGLTCFLVPGV